MEDSIIKDKALKAGLNRFPERIIGTKNTLIEKNAPIDANLAARIIFMEGFIEGYKQSQKDNIENYLPWKKYEDYYDDDCPIPIQLKDLVLICKDNGKYDIGYFIIPGDKFFTLNDIKNIINIINNK